MNYEDRIKETTTTAGTGPYTLAGAVAGYRSFSGAFAVGTASIPVCIVDASGNWQVSSCTLAGASSLTVNAVLSSSNGGAAVTFGAGSKDIFCVLPSSHARKFVTSDQLAFTTTIPLTSGGTRYMPQQSVTGPLAFTLGAAPVANSFVYARLVANGADLPTFTGFLEDGGSMGYNNQSGIANQVIFYHDGMAAYYLIKQAVNAVATPAAASGVTMSGPASGVVSTASTNFSIGVSPNGGTISGTVVVTPSDGGSGGTFTPTTVSLTSAAPTATFTYTPSTTGAKTISVTNNGGLTNPSNITYTVSAAATVPGAPTIGTATPGSAAVSVAFTPPASNGGATITSYTATSSPGGITATGASSPINVTGLTNGTAYTFTVTATNSVGTGAASAASNSATPVASSLMLDSLSSTPVAVYSLRRLRSAYTGPLIRVYSPTTTTYTDIGYDGSGNLDQAALNAAASAGGALKLAQFYDQSGNAFHCTNSSAGNFWDFATAGGVATSLGGRPSWKVNGYAPGRLNTGTISVSAAAASAVVGLEATVINAGIVSGASGSNSTDPLYHPSATAGSLAGRWNNVTAATLKANNATASSMPTTGATALYSDGTARVLTGIQLSADSGLNAGFDGWISEVVLFATALSAGDQTAVYDNQKAYYGTP